MHESTRPGVEPEIVVTATRPSENGARGSSRDELVDRIIRINRSATTEFLNRFAEPELSEYLEHLLSAQRPRGRRAVRVRAPGRPGIVTGGE